MRAVIALVVGLAAVTACGGSPDVVTARIIDPAQVPAWPHGPLYRVEVRGIRPVPEGTPEPLRRKIDAIDTIPGLRTPARPVTVGDAVVLGFAARDDGTAEVFRYDTRLGVVIRSPMPPWLPDLTFRTPPAFSPEGRYLAYLAGGEDGTVRVVVRAWQGGLLRAEGPPVRPDPAAPHRGAIQWRDYTQFSAGLPSLVDTAHAWLRFRGRLGDPVVRVDTLGLRPRAGG